MNLIDALKAKQFYGTIDRLQRGEIDEVQARGELDGTKTPDVTPTAALNPADYAAELKERGVGRSESWSRWIQRTDLNPGMDAKDWYQIYDAVSAASATAKKQREYPGGMVTPSLPKFNKTNTEFVEKANAEHKTVAAKKP